MQGFPGQLQGSKAVLLATHVTAAGNRQGQQGRFETGNRGSDGLMPDNKEKGGRTLLFRSFFTTTSQSKMVSRLDTVGSWHQWYP